MTHVQELYVYKVGEGGGASEFSGSPMNVLVLCGVVHCACMCGDGHTCILVAKSVRLIVFT